MRSPRSILAAEVGGMNTWHVDFSRPDWRCPDCTWTAEGPDGPELAEACEFHAGTALRSTA